MTVTTLGGGLAALPEIGLEELNAVASLMTRVDRKYLLPRSDLDALLAALPAGSRALEVHAERTPLYDTLYLDTPDLDAYLATARRRRRRWKVRQRTYVASAVHFLEVKTRTGPTTQKQRLPWSGDLPLDGGGGAFVAGCLHRAGTDLEAGSLGPRLRTRYRRATILLPGRPARVTLDLDLHWSLPDDATGLSWDDRVVLETKTTGAPCAVDRELWTAGHRPVSLSKYACGLALLRPDLPRNRWHRLLSD